MQHLVMKEKIALGVSALALAGLVATGVITASQALEFARNIVFLVSQISEIAQAG